MNLKLRYALFLFAVFALLVISCALSVFLLTRGYYLLTTILLALLYVITFVLGRKFSRIFFVLSFLRLLRRSGGKVSLEKFEMFMDNALSKRKKTDERARLKREVLDILKKEGVVSCDGESIVLLSP